MQMIKDYRWLIGVLVAALLVAVAAALVVQGRGASEGKGDNRPVAVQEWDARVLSIMGSSLGGSCSSPEECKGPAAQARVKQGIDQLRALATPGSLEPVRAAHVAWLEASATVLELNWNAQLDGTLPATEEAATQRARATLAEAGRSMLRIRCESAVRAPSDGCQLPPKASVDAMIAPQP